LSQSGLVLLGIGADLQMLNLSGADLSHLTLGKVLKQPMTERRCISQVTEV
jgi:hypothetical protein